MKIICIFIKFYNVKVGFWDIKKKKKACKKVAKINEGTVKRF